jgi:hypothetical protein
MSLEALLDQYQSVGLSHEGHLLLPFRDAMGLIKDCYNSQQIIIRMDFWKAGNPIEKSSFWADLSSLAASSSPAKRAAKAAARILALPKPNGETHVSFTFQKS